MLLTNYIDSLKDETVSLLLDLNKDSTFKESYSGILIETHTDFVVLDLNNPNISFKLKYLVVKKELIKSIWIYK